MTLDLTKPIQTRDGRAVRILASDVKGTYPLVAAVTRRNTNREAVEAYTIEGRFLNNRENPLDLINLPPPRESVFFNLGNGLSALKTAAEWHKGWAVVEVQVEGDKIVNTILHKKEGDSITA